MIDQWHPIFDFHDRNAVADVVASGWVNEGRLTQEFERGFAEAVGSRYAVACANGTLAIYMALSLLPPNLPLALPATSAIGDVRAVQMAGLSFSVEDTFSDKPILGSIKMGFTPFSISINGYFETAGCGAIEDASQSLGSRHEGKQIGTFARIGCFSLAPSKIITTGQGGVCVTDSEFLYNKMMAFKDQGRARDYSATIQATRYGEQGTNLKFDDVKAALGLSQLDKLQVRIKHKREVYRIYKEILGEDMMPMEKEELPWYPMINLNSSKRARGNPAKRSIENVIALMAARGVQLKQFPETVTAQMGLGGSFPNAEAFHEYCAYLPCSPDLSLDDAARVAHELKAVL